MKETQRVSSKWVWLSAVVFGLLYSAIFYLLKDQLTGSFQQTTQALPIYEFTSNSAFQTQEIAEKYGIYGGVIFMILAFIITPILLLLRKMLFISKYRWSSPLIMMILYGLFVAL